MEVALGRDDPDELHVAVSSGALKWDEAGTLCLRLAERADPNVRGNAVLDLGHLARRFGHLSAAAVSVVETARSDGSTYVRGQAEAAPDDVGSFVQP